MNVAIQTEAGTLLLVNEALARLEQEDPRKAELVKLRYFAGMTIPEAGDVLAKRRVQSGWETTGLGQWKLFRPGQGRRGEDLGHCERRHSS